MGVHTGDIIRGRCRDCGLRVEDGYRCAVCAAVIIWTNRVQWNRAEAQNALFDGVRAPRPHLQKLREGG